MALSNELVRKLRVKHGTSKIILSLEEKGFCVALMNDGTTCEHEARDIPEFLQKTKLANISWIDYIVDDLNGSASKAALDFGFSEQLITPLLKSTRSSYEDLDSELGLRIPAIIVNGFDVKIEYLLILMRKNLVVTIHTTEVKRFFRIRRYAKIFMRKIKPKLSPQDKLTSVLIRIIDENNARNFDHLREIEENSDKLSAKLSTINSRREELGKDIHLMKHALISYLNGLWETVDVLNTLRYGDPELLTDDPIILQRMSGLVAEVNGQIGLAEHMSEVLASGLEVIQSIYNNQLQVLNNKLALLVAYLTVIGTAVLVPNTLATALGSDVFHLGPEDAWWYILVILGSTVLSTVVAYWWVKSRGLLPDRPD
ncbi:CorA-like Mg2+ transporter protein [Candidatus Bilamarchaeum dharawalense]|uniref:CorA-like Mg2+ transporter protein n=1 Tax=Candidatus Bilamarchaeum dharawalense TaxID=2885759 RepID=A0A5E4LV38_9ARCH|nr:CorA-like Mg2+ transporter protein [Candidatus Bilamarchaeum dharawalense]